MKLKQNLNKTVSIQFQNGFVSAKTKRPGRELFSQHCRYPLFARQSRGVGDDVCVTSL